MSCNTDPCTCNLIFRIHFQGPLNPLPLPFNCQRQLKLESIHAWQHEAPAAHLAMLCFRLVNVCPKVQAGEELHGFRGIGDCMGGIPVSLHYLKCSCVYNIDHEQMGIVGDS